MSGGQVFAPLHLSSVGQGQWAVIARTAADPAWSIYVTTGADEEKARTIAAALNTGQEAALDNQRGAA
jgi:hypothetical protein